MNELISIKKKLTDLGKAKKTPLNSKDKELADLLAKCQHQNHLIVKTSTDILSQAVHQKWIDVNSLIPELQLTISTATHPHFLVFLLCDVLRIQSSLQTVLLKNHPLVSININRSDLLQASIIASVQLLKTHCDVQSLQVMEPFFKYVLLQPNSSNVSLADNLHDLLIELVVDGSILSVSIIELLMRLSSFYQCHPLNCLWSCYHRINAICKTVVYWTKTNNEMYYIDQAVHCCLSITVELTRQSLPLLDLLSTLEQLLEFNNLSAVTLLCLSWLLMNNVTDPMTVKAIIDIVQKNASKTHPCFLYLFKLPLVVLLFQSPSFGYWKTNKSSAVQLLNSMNESEVKNLKSYSKCIKSFNLSPFYTSMYMLATSYMDYITGNCPDLLESLRSDIKSRHHTDITLLAIVICALEPVNTSILSLYPLLPQALHDMGSTMFSFTMYLLTQIDDAETHFNLLECLPSYCTNSLSTGLVSNTLLTLTKSVDLCPMAVRLISKSWEKDDHIFGSLCKLLNPTSVLSNSEQLISIAATLKDICHVRPQLHGEDCLPYIYQCLSSTDDPLVCSLLLKGLISLCANDVIDPGALWKLLGPQLSLGIYPSVDKCMCEFFSLAANVDNTITQSSKVFLNDALKHLWRFIIKIDIEVASSALIAITKFPVDSHTYKVLPDPLVDLLPSTDDPDLPVLSVQQILLLVLSVAKEKRFQSGALCEVVKYLLKEEIPNIPRGVSYNALQKLSTQHEVEKIQTELKTFLQSCSKIEKGPPGFYLLYELAIDCSSFKQQSLFEVVQKVLKNEVHNDMWNFSECLLWQSFMKHVIETQIKISRSKLPDQKEKQETVITKATDEVLQQLKGLTRCTVYSSMSCLVGVVCTELHWEITPKYTKLLMEYFESILSKQPVHQEQTSLWNVMKILIAIGKTNDLLKSILLCIPPLVYCISQYSWTLYHLSGQLKTLVFALLQLLHNDTVTDITHLTNVAISSILQMLPSCSEIVIDFILNGNKDQSKISLLMASSLLKFNSQLDCSNLLTSVLNRIQTKELTSKEMQIACIDVATSIPLLYSTGQTSIDTSMNAIQVLAECATDSQEPLFYWCLGVVVHDLYIMGGVSVMSLMESVSVRWIQEGQIELEKGHYQQVMSSLLGLAGCLGLSSINSKLQGCTLDNFIKLLLSACLPLLYQCVKSTDEHVKNTGLWILCCVYTNLQQVQQHGKVTVPEDLSYLPEGSSLTIMFSQLQLQLNNSTALITNEQAIEIVNGMAELEISLPLVNWESVLIPLLNRNSFQKSVIRFVIRQSNANIDGLKSVVQFMVHLPILHSLEASSKAEILSGLHCLIDVLSPSETFSVLYYFVSSINNLTSELLLSFAKSLLSLFMSDKCRKSMKDSLCAILQLVCQSLDHLVTFKDELFQPTSPFIDTLSQCFHKSNLPLTNQTLLKNVITCCNTNNSNVSSVVPVFYQYLSSSLSSLEEAWLFHVIYNLCSCDTKECSYNQILLLTYLHEWSKDQEGNDFQLAKLLQLLCGILGLTTSEVKQDVIDWFKAINALKDTVKQKLCEVAVVWLLFKNEPFHSCIQSLISTLRHTTCFNKTIIWTSTIQLL